ncbi:MAG: carbon starvation protein A [Candidatus Pacearchaeota archaeon]|nr:MAG: carbon starvation protein A [Candidatus Pacearchaeota archaeon]
MNSAFILVLALVWFYFGYRVYGKYIEKKIKVSDKNKTPSMKRKEGIDFSPSKKPFLVGHHFASVAGAGPIIGPILAISYFGWAPTILWVLLGAVLIGAMHDYVSLIASVRNGGKSVSVITKKYLNKKVGFVFGVMIWITLILIITVFSVSSAESIIAKPDLVIPLIFITFLALLLGYGVKKYNWNYKLVSIIFLILIFFSVWLGTLFPINVSIKNESFLRIFWITVIFVYAFLASVLPVWLLLRPRDYLSAIQMILILIFGVLCFLIARPVINAPAYISNGVFPIWPILFITVACGAVSGFHGLVSSGTTSKQLSKESHGRAVGYGGMLLEALLAIFVSVVVISGVSWGNNQGGFQFYLQKGWINLFSTGYGNIVSGVFPLIGFSIASLLGAFMVNQFILTSVDTSTRLGRFIISEHLFTKFQNRFLTTLVTLVPAWLIAITNSYETLWRLFGTSNQLIASITMMGVSSYFISKGIKTRFILIPAIFVLITTLSALLFLTFRPGGYFSEGNFFLVVAAMIMFFLGFYVAKEGFKILKKEA